MDVVREMAESLFSGSKQDDITESRSTTIFEDMNSPFTSEMFKYNGALRVLSSCLQTLRDRGDLINQWKGDLGEIHDEVYEPAPKTSR